MNYVVRTRGYPKIAYHVFFPLILSILLTAYSPEENMNYLISSCATILSFMSAFSFAALISLPSIKSPALNKAIFGNKFFSDEVTPILIKLKSHGVYKEVQLTRKKFLSLLLSYICFMSVLLLIVSIFLNKGNHSLISDYFNYAPLTWLIKSLIPHVFMLGIFSLLINILYAIQYFSIANDDE